MLHWIFEDILEEANHKKIYSDNATNFIYVNKEL